MPTLEEREATFAAMEAEWETSKAKQKRVIEALQSDLATVRADAEAKASRIAELESSLATMEAHPDVVAARKQSAISKATRTKADAERIVAEEAAKLAELEA